MLGGVRGNIPFARGDGVHAIVLMAGISNPCDSLVSSEVTESLSRGGLSCFIEHDPMSRGRDAQDCTLTRLCSESLRPTGLDACPTGRLAAGVRGLRRKGRKDENLPQGERFSAALLSSACRIPLSAPWYLCKILAAEPFGPSERRDGPALGTDANVTGDPISGSKGIPKEAASNESCGREVEDLTGRLKRPPTEKTDDENEKIDDGLADKLWRWPRRVVR